MLILKHLFDWSYDLEHEVRANLVYRAFTRIDAGEVKVVSVFEPHTAVIRKGKRRSRPSLAIS